MGIRYRPNFSEKDLRNFIGKKVKIIEEVVQDQLIDAAEQFVANARSVNTYIDRTANLRGSIGYILLKDGVEIFGNFDGAQEGQQVARRKIREVAADLPRGFALMVVAGMEYAVYVEAKGYDVLTGSSLVAESDLERQFDRLKQQLRKVK